MSEAARRVRQAAQDARTDGRPPEFEWDGNPRQYDSPLDRETLDEDCTTQMGRRWEEPRRDTDE